MAETAPRNSGLGRVLIAFYALFAVAATGRSSVQLATKASEAPLPYTLSAVAAVVYIAATLGLARAGDRWRRVAWASVVTELVGVLVVGSLSVFDPAAFPDDTVWSGFGAGYGFLPLARRFGGRGGRGATQPRAPRFSDG